MDEYKKVSVIIVAAGSGTRLVLPLPKQFYVLGDRPVLAHTLQKFQSCAAVDDIILVTSEDYLSYCVEMAIEFCYTKVRKILPGGVNRQASVFCGIQALGQDTDIVLVHDGVRPFVSNQSIVDVINQAAKSKSCVLGVPPKDTIKYCDTDLIVKDTPPREKLWAVQTPQGFTYEVLYEAHKKALREGYTGTDDAVLAERLGYPTKIVPGSYENIKITTEDDLILAEQLLTKGHLY